MAPPKRPTGKDDELRSAGEHFSIALAAAFNVDDYSFRGRTRKLADRLRDVVTERQIERWSRGDSLLRASKFKQLLDRLRGDRAEPAKIKEVERRYRDLQDLWRDKVTPSGPVYSSDRDYFGQKTGVTVDYLLSFYEKLFKLPSFGDIEPFPGVIQPVQPPIKIDSPNLLETIEGLLRDQEGEVRIRLDTQGVESNWAIFQILAEHLYNKAQQDRDYKKSVLLCPIFVDLRSWLDTLEREYPDAEARADAEPEKATLAQREDLLRKGANSLFRSFRGVDVPPLESPMDAVRNRRIVFVVDAGNDGRREPLPRLAEEVLRQVSRLIIVEGPTQKPPEADPPASPATAAPPARGRAAPRHPEPAPRAAGGPWGPVVTHRAWARPIDVRRVAASARRHLRENDPTLPALGQLGESIVTLGIPEIAAQVLTLIKQCRLNANALVSEAVLMACLLAEHLVDVAHIWMGGDNPIVDPARRILFTRLALEDVGLPRGELPLDSLRQLLEHPESPTVGPLSEDFTRLARSIREPLHETLRDLASKERLAPKYRIPPIMTLGQHTRFRYFYSHDPKELKGKATGLVDSSGEWVVKELDRGVRFLLAYLYKDVDPPPGAQEAVAKGEAHAPSGDGPRGPADQFSDCLALFDAEALQFLYRKGDGPLLLGPEVGQRIGEYIRKTLSGLEKRREGLVEFIRDFEVHRSRGPGAKARDALPERRGKLGSEWREEVEGGWNAFMGCLMLRRSHGDDGYRMFDARKIIEALVGPSSRTGDLLLDKPPAKEEIVTALVRQFTPKFQTIPGQSNYRYFGAKAGAALLRPDEIAALISTTFDQIEEEVRAFDRRGNRDKMRVDALAGCLMFAAEAIIHLPSYAPFGGVAGSSEGDAGPDEGDAGPAENDSMPLHRVLFDKLKEEVGYNQDFPELRHARYHMIEAFIRIAPTSFARWALAQLLPFLFTKGDGAAGGRFDRAVEVSSVVAGLLRYDRKLELVLATQVAELSGIALGAGTSSARSRDYPAENLIRKLLDDVGPELIRIFGDTSSWELDPDGGETMPRVFDLASPIHSHIFDAHDRLGPFLPKLARTRLTVEFVGDVAASATWEKILAGQWHNPAVLEVFLLWLRNETRSGFDFEGADQGYFYQERWENFLRILKVWYRREKTASGCGAGAGGFEELIVEMAWEIFINSGDDPDAR